MAGVAAFRRRYPNAAAYLVARDVTRPFRARYGAERVDVVESSN